MKIRMSARIAVVLFGCAPLLSACVNQPVGDFGRRQSSLFHDSALPAAGSWAARQRDEPVSSYPLTDDETELRRIAWDLVRPPTSDFLAQATFTLAWSRVAAQPWADVSEEDYYVAMSRMSFSSHDTRFDYIAAQARSDASRLPAFRDAAARVVKGDGARRAALRALGADELVRNEAYARVQENQRLIAWVDDSLRQRVRAYRRALDRFMIETPSVKAVETEAAIEALKWEVEGRLGGVGAEAGDKAPPRRGFRPRAPKDEPVAVK